MFTSPLLQRRGAFCPFLFQPRASLDAAMTLGGWWGGWGAVGGGADGGVGWGGAGWGGGVGVEGGGLGRGGVGVEGGGGGWGGAGWGVITYGAQVTRTLSLLGRFLFFGV